jgi:hypothetical protein
MAGANALAGVKKKLREIAKGLLADDARRQAIHLLDSGSGKGEQEIRRRRRRRGRRQFGVDLGFELWSAVRWGGKDPTIWLEQMDPAVWLEGMDPAVWLEGMDYGYLGTLD